MNDSSEGSPGGSSRAWLALFVVCVVFSSVHDALWMQGAHQVFTAGFNAVPIDGPAGIASYAVLSLLADASFVLAIWVAVEFVGWFLRRLGVPQTDLHVFVTAAAAVLVLSAAANLIQSRALAALGGVITWELFLNLAEHDYVEILDIVVGQLGVHYFVVLVPISLALAAIGVFYGLRRLSRRSPRLPLPSAGRMLMGSLGFAAAFATLFVIVRAREPAVASTLNWKASASVIGTLASLLTDFDGDGSDLFSVPRDQAPFDPDVNPLAIDIPGNGIDENGLAGDLPLDFPAPEVAHGEQAGGEARPHFLLIFLEGFRADVLGARFQGREISPFLNRLAEEGASSASAFVNSPFTIPSRAQLFGGTITPLHHQKTMIDDFKEWGYHVAYFSGQDDSHGDSETLVGADRADHFYDARQDIERRISRTTRSVALQVSAKTVNERVFAYLDALPNERPLFLYVNFTDTHYPYHHVEVDDILGVDPVPRGEIGSESTQRIVDTYHNTAAYVDAAIERLVERWLEYVGDAPSAILVTSDHGESFFDNGMLGHGRSFDPSEAQVPLVLWRIQGAWPSPIALSDVRWLLRASLPRSGTPSSRVRFVETDREIFHYIGNIRKPFLLGLRNDRGWLEYGLRLDGQLRCFGYPGCEDPDREQATLERLIHDWERLNLDDHEARVEAGQAH